MGINERPNYSPRVGVPHHLIGAFSVATVTIKLVLAGPGIMPVRRSRFQWMIQCPDVSQKNADPGVLLGIRENQDEGEGFGTGLSMIGPSACIISGWAGILRARMVAGSL